MLDLAPRPAFSGHLHPIGDTGNPGVTIREESSLGLATVFSRNEAFAARIVSAYGVEYDAGFVTNGTVAFIGTGPGKWLALRRSGAIGWRDALQLALGDTASVIDQSDGLGVLRITGPRVRQAFEKGFPIDFHPDVFRPGSAAVTIVAHIGVTVWQLDEAPTFELAVFRSLAGSFMHWLSQSAAEFGLAVDATEQAATRGRL